MNPNPGADGDGLNGEFLTETSHEVPLDYLR